MKSGVSLGKWSYLESICRLNYVTRVTEVRETRDLIIQSKYKG